MGQQPFGYAAMLEQFHPTEAVQLTALAEEITAAGGTALAVPVDVTDAGAVDAAVTAVAGLGRADLVLNAAGLMLPNPITDGRVDEWTSGPA